MLTIEKQPDTNCPNFLSDCLEWCILDNDFITDTGTVAQVTLAFNSATLPDGTVFKVFGQEFTIDNTLPAGTYSGLNISGNGGALQYVIALEQAMNNHFLGEFTIVNNFGGVLTVAWNDIGVQGDYISDNDNTVLSAVVTDGTDLETTAAKIQAELWCDGMNTPIATQVQDVTAINGTTQENCFNFSEDIKLQLNSECPNFLDIPLVNTSGQKKLYVRYTSLVPDDDCNYKNTGYFNSDSILVLNGVAQDDDNRGTERFCNFEIEPLNEYSKKCFCDNFAWLYFSLNLNCFFNEFGLSFDYQVEYNIMGATQIATLSGSDGILQIPVGDANIELLTGQTLNEGDTWTITLQAVSDGGTFNLSDANFTKGRCCEEVEIYWLEQGGAYSTLCLSYIESRGVLTEGDRTCIAKPCGLGYMDRLKAGHYRLYNKKSKKQNKLKLEKQYTVDIEDELCMFLASDEYFIREKDRQGNDVMRRILLDYAQTGLYVKGDLVELVIGYEYSDYIKTQSNV